MYTYYGPVRGFDVPVVADSAAEAERKLDRWVRALWKEVPPGVHEAQLDLLSGRRKALYAEDLEILVRRMALGPR